MRTATNGVDITRVADVLSAFVLGLGFGLRGLVQNFLDGLMLQLSGVLEKEDKFELNGSEDEYTVTDISIMGVMATMERIKKTPTADPKPDGGTTPSTPTTPNPKDATALGFVRNGTGTDRAESPTKYVVYFRTTQLLQQCPRRILKPK